MDKRARDLSGVSFARALVHLWALTSWPKYFPKAPPTNTITSGDQISKYEFWRYTNVQTTAFRPYILFAEQKEPQSEHHNKEAR